MERPTVRRHQVWSILDNARMRVEMRVVRVEGPLVHLEGQRGGKPFQTTIRRKSIEAGRRGARLVGAVGPSDLRSRIASVRVTAAEKRTASSLRTTEAPRGVAKCSDEDRKAAAMADEGMSSGAIAEALGITKSRVRLMLERVRNAEYDARALKALGG